MMDYVRDFKDSGVNAAEAKLLFSILSHLISQIQSAFFRCHGLGSVLIISLQAGNLTDDATVTSSSSAWK